MNAKCFDETPDFNFQLGTLRDKLWPVEGSDQKTRNDPFKKIVLLWKLPQLSMVPSILNAIILVSNLSYILDQMIFSPQRK